MTLAKFLNAYMTLEKEIRAVNPQWSVFDYESAMTSTAEQEKLKLCRITRNYVQHNPDGKRFVDPSDEMTAFLEREAALIHNSRDLVKKHIYRAPTVDSKTSIRGAMDVAVKTKTPEYILAVEKGLITGYITPVQILTAYKKASRVTEKLFEHIKPSAVRKLSPDYAKPTDAYIDYVTKDVVIVTSDGTEKGLYAGVIK